MEKIFVEDGSEGIENGGDVELNSLGIHWPSGVTELTLEDGERVGRKQR